MNRIRKEPIRPLRETQLWMVSAVTGAAADAAHPERFITPSSRMDPASRLEVYRSAYRSRLVECLQDDYPVLVQMLGDERFAALGHEYIARYPSSSSNLNGFGRRLPSFCRSDMADLGAVGNFAAELATLEWSLVEVLHAEAAAALDVTELQTSPPDRWAGARFVPSDAVRLLSFEYPVNAYYQQCLDQGDPPDLPDRSPSATLAYRSDVELWRMDLTPTMVRVLSPLLAGETIGGALQGLESTLITQEQAEELGRGLTIWFREWAAAGLFAHIEWT